MEIIYKSPYELKMYEDNPRNNDAAVDAVAASILQFGFLVPIVIDKDAFIVAGHTRQKAAKKLELECIPCIVAEGLTPEQIRAFRLVDNKTAELASWNTELLMEELAALAAVDIDMTAFGFDASLFDVVAAEDDGYTLELPEVAETQPGDMYKLGEHILLCGDATRQYDVARVMGGGFADLLLTDPPYNVAYTGKTAEAMTIANDDMPEAEFREFLQAAFCAADGVMKPAAPFYIWHSENEGYAFRAACKDAEWQVRQCLIWVKTGFVIGRQDYQWQHEPCLYGWKPGGTHYFAPERIHSTVIEDRPDIEHMSKAELKELAKRLLVPDVPTTVVRESKPQANNIHPTMKPVPILAQMIHNSSLRGDTVLDPFSGGGSTLIACEKMGRQCRAVEYDPRYCDAIITRWEKLTGGEKIKM